MNSDVLMNINLKQVLKSHIRRGALATMVTQLTHRSKYEGVGVDSHGRIVKFKEKKILSPLIKTFFTGIHIFEPEIFDYFPKKRKIFCINNDVYAKLVHDDLPIFAYLYHGNWIDLGELKLYLKYHKDHLSQRQWNHFKESLLKLSPGIIFPKI